MRQNISFEEARDMMLSLVSEVPAEQVSLPSAYNRVIAEDIIAHTDVPPFDRSPYDGYALRAYDTLGASRESPVVLRILEEIPAGHMPSQPIAPGTAAKVLTGSPVPQGTDAIVKYEQTEFSADAVTIFEPVTRQDIVLRGEDVRAGSLLLHGGDRIDSAAMGTLAAQGIARPKVYRIPKVGVISIGNELADIEAAISGGMIRDTNRYMLAGAIRQAGAEAVYLGSPGDNAEALAALIKKGLDRCDVILSTGGVSVGDYDITPLAAEKAGLETMVKNITIKPGGKCLYASSGSKLVFCLSGNPAAAMVNFYAVVLPCIRALGGARQSLGKKIKVALAADFHKASIQTRLLRGRLDLTDGAARMQFSGQGSAMLSSAIGCDVLAVIPAGTPGVKAGTLLEGWII